MGTPIINQPQVAILACGIIKKKPVVLETAEGDVIAIRHMMFLSLSYDHYFVEDEPWKPEREPSGFFPPLSRSSTFRKSQGTPPEPLQAAYESATSSAAKSGLVPNSVLTKILWPPPPPPPPHLNQAASSTPPSCSTRAAR